MNPIPSYPQPRQPATTLKSQSTRAVKHKNPEKFKAFVNAECAKRTMNLARKLRRFAAVMAWKKDMLRVGEREDEQSESCD